MLPGHRGRAPRRAKGARGDRRRLPGIHRVLGRGASRPETSGPGCPGHRRAGRRPGVLAALREVFPETTEQRCWVHKTANVLDALPKRLHEEAKAALAAIYTAESRSAALDAVHAFAGQFASFLKATKKVTEELDVLLAFYDFPLQHWIHLCSTNPIGFTFATVRLRQRVTKGAGSREAGLAMVFKLVQAAQDRWRRVNAPHLVALVRAGATFIDGQLRGRSEEGNEEGAAA